MGFEVNQHVERLRRHLPLEADNAELYEELAEVDRGFSFETRALEYTRGLLANPKVKLVVLTGNAGHGKTHLCRRILEEDYGFEPEGALERLSGDPQGERPIEDAKALGRRPLRVIKDLSEIKPISVAGDRLSELLVEDGSVALVCANEGRLRSVVSSRSQELKCIVECLRRSVLAGVTSLDDRVHVVNLNYQSVSVPGRSFLGYVVGKWIDGRRWGVCQKCDAREQCPIVANRNLLHGGSGESAGEALPLSAMESAVRAVEQAGYVLTIRECLMLVAYALTGGMDCKAVESALKVRPRRSLVAEYSLGTNLFDHPLPAARRSQLRVLERIRRLDPGRVGIPEVDDQIGRELDEEETESREQRYRPPPRTIQDRRHETESFVVRFRERRRMAFLSGEPKTEKEVGYSRRLGLMYFDEFSFLLRPGAEEEARRRMEIRDQLVCGLHTLQGIRLPGKPQKLYVVDPAFGEGKSRASILARKIPLRDIRLMSESAWWKEQLDGGDPELTRAVDWIDRRVIVKFGDRIERTLHLDLMSFEIVMRASGGVCQRLFFHAEIRRVLSTLALLAQERDQGEEEIEVIVGGVVRRIDIDLGNRILVST